ncbi:Fe-S cluster domain protein [Desulfosarcina variabilis str. Montpellier]|uniref:(Fe-S)-binding protein n=1 Tax=Desulfosarcina variabilis TaxID=2300 RepID=UPI003AFAD5A6
MLLKTFRLEIVNNHCMPGAMSVNGIARLDQDVGCALPYLNAVLGAIEYIKDPPTATFRTQGRLISVRSDQITVNAVQDREQAEKIIDWIRREINDAWQNRETITPRFKGIDRPQVVKILKHLPHTNCGECRQPTCMVFALRLAEGAKSVDDCPHLEADAKAALDGYLSGFVFDD